MRPIDCVGKPVMRSVPNSRPSSVSTGVVDEAICIVITGRPVSASTTTTPAAVLSTRALLLPDHVST